MLRSLEGLQFVEQRYGGGLDAKWEASESTTMFIVHSRLTERLGIHPIRVHGLWHLQHRLVREVLAHTVCVFLNIMFHPPPLDLDNWFLPERRCAFDVYTWVCRKVAKRNSPCVGGSKLIFAGHAPLKNTSRSRYLRDVGKDRLECGEWRRIESRRVPLLSLVFDSNPKVSRHDGAVGADGQFFQFDLLFAVIQHARMYETDVWHAPELLAVIIHRFLDFNAQCGAGIVVEP